MPALTHIDDRKHEEERQRFLAEAGTLLSESLDARETRDTVVRLAVPALGDCCALHLVDEEGKVELAAFAHVDPGLARQVLESSSASPFFGDSPHGPAKVIRTGLPECIADLTPESWSAMARSPAQRAVMGKLGLRTLLSVPLRSRKAFLGALTVGSSSRPYASRDLKLLDELAARAALALSNAELYESAQRAIRARDEFLSIASHELKTPLTPLKIQTQSFQLLSERGQLASLEPAKLGKMLATADRQVDRLADLIEEMLDVSRLHLGRLVQSLERIDLREVIEEAADRLAPQCEASGCRLEIEILGALPVRGDKGRLEQVLSNLIGNSLKYGPGKPIRVRAWNEGNRVRFSVRDHGIGIEKKDQRRVFERFERAVSAQHFGGLGLGLYICRQIALAHGGNIEVESEPGSGSVFTVTLPAAPATG